MQYIQSTLKQYLIIIKNIGIHNMFQVIYKKHSRNKNSLMVAKINKIKIIKIFNITVRIIVFKIYFKKKITLSINIRIHMSISFSFSVLRA